MRTFTVGDIHGGHLALQQCLDRANFDYKKDRLISLGDIADGWPFVFECVEELTAIKNLIVVRGNHDQWLLDWLQDFSKMPSLWIQQGGKGSLASYNKNRTKKELKRHKKFFENTLPYFIDEENRLYVHGGIDPINADLSSYTTHQLMWDRRLAELVLGAKCALEDNNYQHVSKSKMRRLLIHHANFANLNGQLLVPGFKDVFLGHTTTYQLFPEPASYSNVHLLDTGGGWEGKLSIMNVETKEFFQSDLVSDLYPGVQGRK